MSGYRGRRSEAIVGGACANATFEPTSVDATLATNSRMHSHFLVLDMIIYRQYNYVYKFPHLQVAGRHFHIKKCSKI